MIEKILERLEELIDKSFNESLKGYPFASARNSAYQEAKKIVQEVAKEYGYGRKLSRCDTCTHYIADEVPPICYLCCKGIEDNYEQKGE